MRLAVSQVVFGIDKRLVGSFGYRFRNATQFDGLPAHHVAMLTSEANVALYQ